jgi:hypothetical protein
VIRQENLNERNLLDEATLRHNQEAIKDNWLVF